MTAASRTTVIVAARAMVDGRRRGPVAVRVGADGVVESVEPVESVGSAETVETSGLGEDADVVRLTAGLLTAGLIDLQVNGAYGVDLAAADEAAWRHVAGRLTGTGVTAFLPTFVTAPLAAVAQSAARAQDARAALHDEPVAQPLGVHLEGPFLSTARAGAHEPAWLREPTPAAVDELRRAGGADLRMVTLAPELPGALDAVAALAADGVVVSIGHSDATGAQTAAAAAAGARMVTHLFNAQRGLHHHEPGVAGQALRDDRLTLGLVADLVHVDPVVVELTFRLAGERVALVTDCVAATGMPPGRYELGGDPVVVEVDGGPPRRPDGTLAGSTLTLDAAVRNVVALGVPVEVALEAATTVPADLLGRYDLGRVAPGARADLVWWDDDLVPRRVWVGGVPGSVPGGVTRSG